MRPVLKISWDHLNPFQVLDRPECRLSNRPDFVRIIPILLENPESRPIYRRIRKNSDFNICFMEQEAQENSFVQF